LVVKTKFLRTNCDVLVLAEVSAGGGLALEILGSQGRSGRAEHGSFV
jgi:hypothetical protein